MAQTIISDAWNHIGSTFEEFSKDITAMANATEGINVRAGQITLLSLCKIPEAQKEGKLVFYVLSSDYLYDFMEYGIKLRMGGFDRSDFGEELCKELEEETGLVAIINDEKYIISRATLLTLCQRACVSGDTTVNRSNLIRDMHLADGLYHQNQMIHLVYRQEHGVKKIFAAFSNDFVLCKQDIILKAMQHEDFPWKNCSVRDYRIDNFTTEVELSIGEHVGVIIKNSDIGLSSLIVKVVYRYEDTCIYYGERSLRHDRTLTFDRFLHQTLKEVDEMIQASTFESDMARLKEISIIDYSGFDKWNPFHSYNNKVTIEEILLSSIFELLRGTISKKQVSNVTRMLLEKVDSSIKYTYYDAAMMLFQIPDALQLDDNTIANVRKALAGYPSYALSDMQDALPKLIAV